MGYSEETRPYGKLDGLEKRLAYWAKQLSHDKSFPWVGLGLIDDLKAACSALGGNYDAMFPPITLQTAPQPEEEDEFAVAREQIAQMDYDL